MLQYVAYYRGKAIKRSNSIEIAAKAIRFAQDKDPQFGALGSIVNQITEQAYVVDSETIKEKE